MITSKAAECFLEVFKTQLDKMVILISTERWTKFSIEFSTNQQFKANSYVPKTADTTRISIKYSSTLVNAEFHEHCP